MNELAEIVQRCGAVDGNLARRILEPLTEHDDLLRYLDSIQLRRVRFMRPLAEDQRPDVPALAMRRVAELPKADDLDRWYRLLKQAVQAAPDPDVSRMLVALMLDTLRGRLDNPRVTIDAFALSLEDSRLSPQIVAGAVKLGWARLRTKPSISAFLVLCKEHDHNVREAMDDVCRTIGLRRDAEKVVADFGRRIGADDQAPGLDL